MVTESPLVMRIIIHVYMMISCVKVKESIVSVRMTIIMTNQTMQDEVILDGEKGIAPV